MALATSGLGLGQLGKKMREEANVSCASYAYLVERGRVGATLGFGVAQILEETAAGNARVLIDCCVCTGGTMNNPCTIHT